MTHATQATVIADADSTRGRRLRELVHGRGVAYSVTFGGVGTLLAGAYLHSILVIAAGPLAVAVIAAAVAFRTADRKAEADFFASYACAHGLTLVDRTELLPLTPLLGAGDRRHCGPYMEGPLPGGGTPCGLGHFTFEVLEPEGESGSRRLEKHDFTICVVDLEPGISLYPGIFLTRRRGLFGFVDGVQWVSHANRHKVELECAELCERYDLYVDDAQDELGLRELFAPSFVLWLAQHPLAPCFEYRAVPARGTLVVYLERKLEDAGHLDWMLEATAEIARRFGREIEERQPTAPTNSVKAGTISS